MTDKLISSLENFYSQKRTEFLLEELIYQTIKTRLNEEDAKVEFESSLKHVSNLVLTFYESLPDAK